MRPMPRLATLLRRRLLIGLSVAFPARVYSCVAGGEAPPPARLAAAGFSSRPLAHEWVGRATDKPAGGHRPRLRRPV